MITKEHITGLLAEIIDTSLLFVVNVDVAAGNKITIHIDSNAGITIDDCATISRAIGDKIDGEAEDFELEVSSPGLGSAFKVIQQYHKYVGKEVEILLHNGIKLKAVLLLVSETGIEAAAEKIVRNETTKKKKKLIETCHFEFSDIKHTKLILSFK